MSTTDAEYLAQKRAEAEARSAKSDQVTVLEWDKRMQRVFKGVMPRPYRWAMLKQLQRRMEAGTHGPKQTNDKKPRRRGGGARP